MDPNAGAVLLDGIDIRSIRLRSLRQTISVVFQHPAILPTTIRENVLLANPRLTLKEIHLLLEVVCLHDLVDRLRNGIDAVIPPGLSGGERQRLALARGLASESRVLVLDEITSALDPRTEEVILRNIKQFVADRTILIISHRPQPLLWADRILMLRDGKVSENGSHVNLFQTSQYYRALFHSFDEESNARQAEGASSTWSVV
jgi:ATP-binding cassette subfamily B protein